MQFRMVPESLRLSDSIDLTIEKRARLNALLEKHEWLSAAGVMQFYAGDRDVGVASDDVTNVLLDLDGASAFSASSMVKRGVSKALAKRAEDSLAQILLGNRTISSGYWGDAEPWVTEFLSELLALGGEGCFVEANFTVMLDDGETTCSWTATLIKEKPRKNVAKSPRKLGSQTKGQNAPEGARLTVHFEWNEIHEDFD